jgi:hypothetical protein
MRRRPNSSESLLVDSAPGSTPADPQAARPSANIPTIAPDFSENAIFTSEYVSMFQSAPNTEMGRICANMEALQQVQNSYRKSDPEISMINACREISAYFKFEFPMFKSACALE